MSEALHPADLPALDERSIAILDFERSWGARSSGREAEIRARFEISPPRYFQLLNQLIDEPAALAHDPLLVRRLRRLREMRQQARSAARLPR